MKAITDAKTCQFYKIAEPGISANKLAIKVEQFIESHHVQSYARHLQNEIHKFVKKVTIIKETDIVMRKFYNLICSTTERTKWNEMLVNIGCENSTASVFLFNDVADSFLKQNINYYSGKIELEMLDVDAMRLTKHEEQSLYYVAGYLVFSLKKTIWKLTGKENTTLYKLLNNWGCKGDSTYKDLGIQEYVASWVNQTDRGGLFQVNSNFYEFVVKIEKILELF